MVSSAIAQPENLPADLKPGMTPDNPFYFLDILFDGLQSSESVANEKAAEVVAMAHENKVSALEKARERYEKAMEERNREAQETEEEAEEVTRQASRHMEVLSAVYENVPEEAKLGIEEAMKNSAQGRENALKSLTEKNSEKGASVAEETLTGILERAPEQAKAGLQRALEAVGSGIPSAQSGEAGGFPSQNREGAPEERGPPSDILQGNETEEVECNIDEDCEAGFECVRGECEEIEAEEEEVEENESEQIET